MKRLLCTLLAMLFALQLMAAERPADTDYPQGKLPGEVRPLSYDLELLVDPSEANFSGRARIRVQLDRGASWIFLHGEGLEVSSVTARWGSNVATGSYQQLDNSGVARVDWSRPLPAGVVTLDFIYSAAFRSSAEGLFRADLGGHWYAWTQLQPIDARRVFPGFDEPGFKTPFNVQITAPEGMRAFANAPEVSQRAAAQAGMTVHRFAASKPLPTSLFAIAVGAFEVGETLIPANAVRRGPLAFRVIAPRGSRAEMNFALAETPRLLALLESYLHSPYPFQKLDFVASPLMGGGMENPGLVLFNDSQILFGAPVSASERAGFGSLVGHELAHQWFGDSVTPTWWTDLWLNESFASWMASRIAQRWDPEHDYAESRILGAFEAMNEDALATGRPVRQPITDNSMIASIFDAITYQKGEQVLAMFEAYLGEDAFRRGVQLYLQRFAHKNASAEDFFMSLAQASGKPQIGGALGPFIDQVGVPLITIEREDGKLRLHQSRYRPLGVETARAPLWSVPLCIRRGSAERCVLLEEQSATIQLPGSDDPATDDADAVLVPNPGANGYYRYSLARADWQRLIAVAPTLESHDALAFADSLWADFAAGRSQLSDVIAAARTLGRHPDAGVAKFMAGHLKRLAATMLALDQLPNYRKLMGEIYGERFRELGWNLASGYYASEPPERRSERQSIMESAALEFRDPALRQALANSVQAWLKGDEKALDPAYRSLAMQVGVQELGKPFSQQLEAILTDSSDPQLRGLASRGLSAIPAGEGADSVMALAVAGKIRSIELYVVLRGFMQRPDTRERAAEFIDKHFDIAMTSLPKVARTRIIDLFDSYCDAADAHKVEATFRPKLAQLGGGDLNIRKTEEAIRVCAALKAASEAQLRAAFGASVLRPAEKSP